MENILLPSEQKELNNLHIAINNRENNAPLVISEGKESWRAYKKQHTDQKKGHWI